MYAFILCLLIGITTRRDKPYHDIECETLELNHYKISHECRHQLVVWDGNDLRYAYSWRWTPFLDDNGQIAYKPLNEHVILYDGRYWHVYLWEDWCVYHFRAPLFMETVTSYDVERQWRIEQRWLLEQKMKK